MSYTVDRSQHQERIFSQPVQIDTQATFVVPEPPSQPQSDEQQQQPHEPQKMDSNGNSIPPQSDEIKRLMEEVDRLRMRNVQLENRTASSESGYMELKYAKETQAKENLDHYKSIAEKRFEASQAEIAAYEEMTQAGRQHLNLVSSRTEIARAELVDLKTTPLKAIQNENIRRQEERYQKRYEVEAENVQTLENKLRKLEEEYEKQLRRRQRNPKQIETISTLQHRTEQLQQLSGMEIVDRKKTPDYDIYTISQSGRNGRISFKVTIFQNGAGELTARYSPLFGGSDDHLLLANLNEQMEFPYADAKRLFWRTATALNEKLDGKNISN